jgi:hypothetical protein
MIKRYNEFLFEYNNRNLKFKVFELKQKYPDLVTDKFDKEQNDNFIKFIKNYNSYFKLTRHFTDFFSDEFMNECSNMGIDIYFMLLKIIEFGEDDYIKCFLYDGENLILCPGGGDDYPSARIAGSGINKIAYTSKDYILKRKQDVSDIEVRITTKYPQYFAQYTSAGEYYKQEKLQTVNQFTETDLHNYDELEKSIHRICIIENFGMPDLHHGNVGYDKNGVMKCFDFM